MQWYLRLEKAIEIPWILLPLCLIKTTNAYVFGDIALHLVNCYMGKFSLRK